MTTTIKKQGVQVPYGRNYGVPEVSSAWGARAILRNGAGNPIDIVGDRQGAAGPRSSEIVEYLNTHVGRLDYDGWIDPSSEGQVTLYSDEEFVVVGSPQGSYGYLYIRAWFRDDEYTEADDITYATVLEQIAEAQHYIGQLADALAGDEHCDSGYAMTAEDVKIILDGAFTNLTDLTGGK